MTRLLSSNWLFACIDYTVGRYDLHPRSQVNLRLVEFFARVSTPDSAHALRTPTHRRTNDRGFLMPAIRRLAVANKMRAMDSLATRRTLVS